MIVANDASVFAARPQGVNEARVSSSSIVLEVAGVTKTFAGRTAIEDISFSATGGEFLALLGPSGAGKTTLLRCMAGLTVSDRGTVRLDGTDIAALVRRERRRIAVVFQQFNLVGRLTALDNVLAGRLGHVPAWRGMLRRFNRDDRFIAMECLERVGLLTHAQQRADTLSGGQQQRVAIARALTQWPEVILADEPIASLDPKIGAGILELLRGICHDDGVAVVCSLHQVDMARAYADRIIGLAHGRTVADAPTAAFDAQAMMRLYDSDAVDSLHK